MGKHNLFSFMFPQVPAFFQIFIKIYFLKSAETEKNHEIVAQNSKGKVFLLQALGEPVG
jgi:hypothetical protein